MTYRSLTLWVIYVMATPFLKPQGSVIYLSELAAMYGGTKPYRLSDYYKGAENGFVPDAPSTTNIPAKTNAAGEIQTLKISRFYGTSKEYVINVTSSTTNYNWYTVFSTTFTPLSTPYIARLVIGSGATIGATSTSTAALTVGGFPSGTYVFIDNNGQIYGAHGAGSTSTSVAGGAGGDALNANTTGLVVSIKNAGSIFGGGGGGGKGIPGSSGNAGSNGTQSYQGLGQYTSTTQYDFNSTYWFTRNGGLVRILWQGSLVGEGGAYTAGSEQWSTTVSGRGFSYTDRRYSVTYSYMYYPTLYYTTYGGAGGAAGVGGNGASGRGHNNSTAALTGIAGGAGGAGQAGEGGNVTAATSGSDGTVGQKGGDGGDWGAAGSAGIGSGASAGGAAGRAINKGSLSITLANTGAGSVRGAT